MRDFTAHKLKGNLGSEFPARWIFFDVESTPERIGKGETSHKLRLGSACYWQRKASKRPEREKWIQFEEPSELWSWISEHVNKRERVVVVSHNLAFNATVTAAVPELLALGWTSKALISERRVNIWKFRLGSRSLLIIDSLNLFKAPLSELGESVGNPRISIDAATASEEELAAHCRRDVEILLATFRRYADFLREHELGSFAVTSAAQSIASYRHRFMPHEIMIHANKHAIKLERASYHGGRCECFYLGELPRGEYFHLDYCSMYPAIMASHRLPWRLAGACLDPEPHEIERILGRDLVIAEVELETDEPVYPLPRDGRLLFPIGRFRATLADPELRHALERDRIRSIGALAWYDSEDLFSGFVSELYALRISALSSGDRLGESFVKLILNSLYGKFAQTGRRWRKLGEAPAGDVWIDRGYFGDGTPYLERAIGGIHETLEISGNSINSFVAISSMITSYGRLLLWSLIERVGREHVLYCDTDSVIVDAHGRAELDPLVSDQRELGSLRVIGEASGGWIHGAKEYKLGDVRRLKGIRSNAEDLGGGRFEMDINPSFQSVLRSGKLSEYVVRRGIRSLSAEYLKGSLSAGGRVDPLQIVT